MLSKMMKNYSMEPDQAFRKHKVSVTVVGADCPETTYTNIKQGALALRLKGS